MMAMPKFFLPKFEQETLAHEYMVTRIMGIIFILKIV